MRELAPADTAPEALNGIERPARNKKLLTNIHSFRALAIFLIVAGHTFFPLSNATATRVIVDTLDDSSIFFVFVAGYLFRHLHGDYHFFGYLRKKFTNVILPYLFVATPGVILAVGRRHDLLRYPQLAGHHLPFRMAWFYIHSGAQINSALWYIPMITLMYLAAPALSAVIRNPRWYGVIIPLTALSMLIHRMPVSEKTDIVHLWLYFLPAYMLGMWFSQFGEELLGGLDRRLGLLLILIVACVAAMPILITGHVGNYTESGYFTFESGIIDWTFLQKAVLAMLLVVAFRRLPKAAHRVLAPLGDASFAIYFVHMYWLALLLRLFPLQGMSGPAANWQDAHGDLLQWISFTVATMALSYATAATVKKLAPRWHRSLIGY
jgi:peptidoglycan/LPS O-acetylase OafA/YrhL